MANSEQADNLRSVAFANVIDLVCEGEIEGLVDGEKSIYLDEVAVQNADGSFNFDDFTYTAKNGTNNQGTQAEQVGIQSISELGSVTENEVTVNAEVKQTTSIVRSITDSDVNSVRIKITVPTLLSQNNETGDLSGTSVEIAIDLQIDGGGYVEKIRDTINGKTTSQYQRDYVIAFGEVSGTKDIRVRRITADSNSVYLNNKTYFSSYTEIVNTFMRYPNSAYVKTRFDSSQFSNLPSRAYLMKLLKIQVPSNYNPTTRAYSGVWDGTFQTAWTDNPAWVFYDLLTNSRYGLGEYISASQVDKWALYEISQYCDELVDDGFGGTEPRFTCNCYLQTRDEAYRVLQNLASVFNSMVFWEGGTITVSQDKPSDPVYQYTTANVINGMFNYQGVSAKARHTVALVTWNDPDDFYRQKVEYVEDTDGIARYGVIETEIVAFGCTSRGQANRAGRWLLYTELNETETVTFATGIEGAVVRPGQIVQIADPLRAGERLGGRIGAVTSSSVTVDQTFGRDIVGWTLSVMLPDQTISEHTITAQNSNVLSITPSFSTQPQVNSIWVVRSSVIDTQLFRVISCVEDEQGNNTITALAYNENKFDAVEDGLTLQTRTITKLGEIPDLVSEIDVTEQLYAVRNDFHILIAVSWEPIQGAIAYEVRYRVNNSNYVSLGETSSPYIEFRNSEAGNYDFQIRSKGFTEKPPLRQM
jgi:predicted phage tail protein